MPREEPAYRVVRCANTKCGKRFQTRKKDQRFHCDKCRYTYHNAERSRLVELARRQEVTA